MRQIKELRHDHIDDNGVHHIDGYFTNNENIPGETLVTLSVLEKRVLSWSPEFLHSRRLIDYLEGMTDGMDIHAPGFVHCHVMEQHTTFIVTLNNGSMMLLQTDLEQLCFAKSCGLITDDNATTEALADVDLTDIQQCSDEYLTVAEFCDCPKCGRQNLTSQSCDDKLITSCDDCDWVTEDVE